MTLSRGNTVYHAGRGLVTAMVSLVVFSLYQAVAGEVEEPLIALVEERLVPFSPGYFMRQPHGRSGCRLHRDGCTGGNMDSGSHGFNHTQSKCPVKHRVEKLETGTGIEQREERRCFSGRTASHLPSIISPMRMRICS